MRVLKWLIFTAIPMMFFAVLSQVNAASYVPQFHHSATMCKHISGGTLGMWNQGVISNEHWSQTLTVMCPVVRENDYDRIGTMSVYVMDRNNSAGVKCSWYDVEAYGRSGNWWWSGWKTSNGGSVNNIKTITWTREASWNKFSGYSHLLCTIPPKTSTGRSYIASYRIGE